MPPKQRITREMILERSFAMFCQEGMEAVNARSVAKALNCSTQPIFSYFSGMEDLKDSLDLKARELFEETLNGAARESETLNSYCLAYVRFADAQPHLFSRMFLRLSDTAGSFMHLLNESLWQAESQQNGISVEQARIVCNDTLVYAHGLAAVAASRKGFMPLEEIENRVLEVHQANLLLARQHDSEQ